MNNECSLDAKISKKLLRMKINAILRNRYYISDIILSF